MTESIDKVVERVTEGGNLLANLARIDGSTWETSQQVYDAWQKGAAVEGVNTNDMAIYRLVDGEVVFNLLGPEGNLFVPEGFRADTYNGILQNEFFMPQGDMKDHVMSAVDGGASLEINYSGLNIKTDGCAESYCFIEFDGNNTDEENKLFSGVYGVENPGDGKRIYLLRENIVKAQLSERPDDLVARACCLYGDQDFDASDWDFLDYGSAVRGVLLDSAEGGAPDESNKKQPDQFLVAPDFRKGYGAMVRGDSVLETKHGTYVLTAVPVTTK